MGVVQKNLSFVSLYLESDFANPWFYPSCLSSLSSLSCIILGHALLSWSQIVSWFGHAYFCESFLNTDREQSRRPCPSRTKHPALIGGANLGIRQDIRYPVPMLFWPRCHAVFLVSFEHVATRGFIGFKPCEIINNCCLLPLLILVVGSIFVSTNPVALLSSTDKIGPSNYSWSHLPRLITVQRASERLYPLHSLFSLRPNHGRTRQNEPASAEPHLFINNSQIPITLICVFSICLGPALRL